MKRSTKPLQRSPLKRSTTPIAKKAKRKASWVVENGVRIFLKTGREDCITDAAWNHRRWETFHGQRGVCGICGYEIHMPMVNGFDVHHRFGRKPKDDRIWILIKDNECRLDYPKMTPKLTSVEFRDGGYSKRNLIATHHDCHMEEHNQGWSKGELKWTPKNK